MLSMLAAHSWIIIAFTQVAKELILNPTDKNNWVKVAAILIGGMTGFALSGFALEGFGWGLVAGVTATGTFSAGKEYAKAKAQIITTGDVVVDPSLDKDAIQK